MHAIGAFVMRINATALLIKRAPISQRLISFAERFLGLICQRIMLILIAILLNRAS